MCPPGNQVWYENSILNPGILSSGTSSSWLSISAASYVENKAKKRGVRWGENGVYYLQTQGEMGGTLVGSRVK